MDGVGAQRSTPTRNRPAKVSVYFTGFGIAALANFTTGIAWINPALLVGMAVLCALAAIASYALFGGRPRDWRPRCDP
jgi:hypothetical protein